MNLKTPHVSKNSKRQNDRGENRLSSHAFGQTPLFRLTSSLMVAYNPNQKALINSIKKIVFLESGVCFPNSPVQCVPTYALLLSVLQIFEIE